MEGRQLLQYLIDTSDVVLAKKQEATEYLAKLENAAKQSVQADKPLVVRDSAGVVTCAVCGTGLDVESAEEVAE